MRMCMIIRVLEKEPEKVWLDATMEEFKLAQKMAKKKNLTVSTYIKYLLYKAYREGDSV